MYKEMTCPYCDHDFDLCHDDGAYYNPEDKGETCECPECGKAFMVYSTQSWDFEGRKADCLNGEPHNWQPQRGYPEAYSWERYTCADCDKEERRDEEGRKIKMEEYCKSIDEKFPSSKT